MTRDYDDRGTFNDKTNTATDIDINDFTPTTGSNFELHKRIKALEDWKNNPPSRLDKLEEQYHSHVELDHKIVTSLYNDAGGFKQRLEKLEKWKEGLGEEVHKLDHVMILNRIDKLEEWKRGNIKEINDGQDFKVMDKKIWDNIKLRVRLLSEYGCPERIGGGQNYNISELIELVKQVDPDWKPYDRLPNPSGDMCVTRKIKIGREAWEGIKSIVSQMRGHTCIPWAYQQKLDEIVKKVETG